MNERHRIHAEAQLRDYAASREQAQAESWVDDGFDAVAAGVVNQVHGDAALYEELRRVVRLPSERLRAYRVAERDVTRLEPGEPRYRLLGPGQEPEVGEHVSASLDQLRDPALRHRRLEVERAEHQQKRQAALQAVERAGSAAEAAALQEQVPPPWVDPDESPLTDQERVAAAIFALELERDHLGGPAFDAQQLDTVERVARSGDAALRRQVYVEQAVARGPDGEAVHCGVHRWDPAAGEDFAPKGKALSVEALLNSKRVELAGHVLRQHGPVLGREALRAVASVGVFGNQVEPGEDV